jgi:hypothetical protein
MNICHFELPFGIEIEVRDGTPSIESSLGEVLADDTLGAEETLRIGGVIEGIEHLLMSLAKAGADLTLPVYAQALRDCIVNLQPCAHEALATQACAVCSRQTLNIQEKEE